MSDLRTIQYDEKRERYVIDPDWQGFIPYWLTPERNLTVTAAANSPVQVPLPLRHDGIFRGEYFLIRSTAGYTLRMSTNGGYRFNNNDIPVYGPLVASAFAGRPFVLSEAIMLRFGQLLSLEVTDISAAPNNLQIAIAGVLYLPVRFGTDALEKRVKNELERYDWLRPHWAAPDGDGTPLVVPAAGQVDFEFTIDQQGFFEVSKIGIAADSLANISMRLWDTADRSLSYFQMHSLLWGGTAEYPLILPCKWGLLPNTRVHGTLYNSGAAPMNVNIALIGRRLLGNVERV
jgi:hypothetical protein